MAARVKGGSKAAGSTSKKHNHAIQGHGFEVLGTNPSNLKSGGVSPNRTINVPASNKRHIDVSEFGDKRDVSKSPGLGPENSIVNQDLTFSLGIETQVEGNNVLDISQTVHSQVQSRSSSPLDITSNKLQNPVNKT